MKIRAFIYLVCLLSLPGVAVGQLVVDYNFTTNTTVPDNGQITDTRTLGGFASYSDVNVNLNLGTSNVNDPMWLGDMYSTLTLGTALESSRAAVLLNRPGVDNTDAFGSSLDSLNVTLDESGASNIWGTTSSAGTYKSDGRLVDPYGPGVAFDENARSNTLTSLNGSALTSNKFTLLVADTQQGGTATLSNWGLSVTGTAAGSGILSAGGGTMSISDTGSGATNNVGAQVVTTQSTGDPLSVNIAGAMTFSGGVTGTGGLTKLGTGTLTLSTANGYTGNTIVNGGTLLATNVSGSATSTGTVTVNNSGTLGGTGFIDGAVTVNEGAAITGGTNGTVGTLTLASLAVTGVTDSLASYLVDISGGTADRLTVSGLLDLGGDFDRIAFSGTPDGTTTYTLASFGSISGTFNTVSDLPNGYELSYAGGFVQLVPTTPVPEPATWIGGLLTVGAVAFSQRRRLRGLFARKLA